MRKILSILLLFVLLLLCRPAGAQSIEYLWSGWVLDQFDVQPMSDVHVFNKNTNIVTITNKNGLFSIMGAIGDSIRVSCIGYATHNTVIKDTTERPVIFLEPVIYDLGGVVIFPDTLRLSGLAAVLRQAQQEGNFSQRPSWGFGPVIGGPVTLLYNAFSKTAKQERVYRAKVMGTDDDMVIGSKFNGNIVNDLTGLQGDELINFMAWCGFSRKYLLTANDGQIEKNILDKWFQYKKLTR